MRSFLKFLAVAAVATAFAAPAAAAGFPGGPGGAGPILPPSGGGDVSGPPGPSGPGHGPRGVAPPNPGGPNAGFKPPHSGAPPTSGASPGFAGHGRSGGDWKRRPRYYWTGGGPIFVPELHGDYVYGDDDYDDGSDPTDCQVYRKAFDRSGHFLGWVRVNLCEDQ